LLRVAFQYVGIVSIYCTIASGKSKISDSSAFLALTLVERRALTSFPYTFLYKNIGEAFSQQPHHICIAQLKISMPVGIQKLIQPSFQFSLSFLVICCKVLVSDLFTSRQKLIKSCLTFWVLLYCLLQHGRFVFTSILLCLGLELFIAQFTKKW
jgi:hypothetical protein